MFCIRFNKVLVAGSVCSLLFAMMLAGCEKTVPVKPNSELRAAGEIPDIESADSNSEAGDMQEVVFKSGMEIGEVPLPFDVNDVTGPNKGKHLCYRCLYGGRPVVGIFVREFDENAKTLIKKIDQEVANHQDEKMAAFVVLLTDDPESAKPELQKIATETKIKNVPLTVFQGTDGPRGYNVKKDAIVNVMMWEGDVKANRAYQKGQLNNQEIEEVLADSRLMVD